MASSVSILKLCLCFADVLDDVFVLYITITVVASNYRMSGVNRKRVTMKHKHPNPLFEQWLIEWRDKAREKNSKMQHCFSLALSTLRKYPLPLESGKDCKILKGFGEKLCAMLDEKLKQHKSESKNIDINNVQLITDIKSNTNLVAQKSKRPQKSNIEEYVPQQGSGSFLILITLYEKSLEPGYPGHLTKNEIMEKCQHIVWSSMKILLEKKLVNKEGKPAKFSLTYEGSTLADKLYIQQKIEEFQKEQEYEQSPCSSSSVVGNKDNLAVPLCTGFNAKKVEVNGGSLWHQTSSTSTTFVHSNAPHETVILAPNSFEIILLVDTQEISGNKNNADKDPIIVDLNNLNVRHEARNLKVGDYAWISRDNFGNELVLPYIIERKRMDDFGKSIKDDRFHEQKFRLRQCGIPNLIYLIESYGKNEHVGLPINTLYQAAANTLVHDGFTVKFTNNGKSSCEYLACLTSFLINLFKEKTLVSCPKQDLPPLALDEDLIHLMLFKDFNRSSSKSKHFKVKEMFIRQLLQIKGMSVDRALAIVDKYPTPTILRISYTNMSESQGEKLLSNIQYGTLKKNIGPVLSRIVYQFFCNNVY